MRAIFSSFFLAASLFACSQPETDRSTQEPSQTSLAVGELRIADAVMRRPLGGRTTTAIYFNIDNTGETPDRLLSASSPAAKTIEIHTHKHEDGVMRMRRIDGADIPPADETVFAPGGLHLMVFGVSEEALNAGEIEVTLVFQNAGEARLTARVGEISAD